MPDKFQAFFSYAHADEELDPDLFEAFSTELEKRASALLVNGDIHIWRDTQKIRTGHRWDARIEEALRNSHLLIVMLSPKWLQSDYCRKEYRIFQQVEKNLPSAEFVFPLLVYGVEEEREYLVGDQREVFDSLMAREYKPVLAKNFLLMTPNQVSAQVAAVAEEIRAPIKLLRRRPAPEPPIAPAAVTAPPAPPPPQIVPDISRIFRYVPEKLIGREAEIRILDDAWAKARNDEQSRPHVLTFVALGGEGKTSLVAKWAAELAYKGWPGCEAAFAWSFYSQGTREQMAASSDLFLKAALVFFGDVAMAESAQSAFDKGKRLARLVAEKRALLILDGLESLQYAPTSPTKGELKDEGLKALLKGLAQNSRGLCVVTTRHSIPDLRAFHQGAAPEIALKRLSKEAGVELLRALGVNGTQKEYERIVEDVKGHALTLNLLGSFLRDAHGGDIRQCDLVKLEEADEEEQGGHAFRAMDAYAQWFESEGEKGERALALLRLLGLFDRPADASCLGALWKAPAIEGLTEPLTAMSKAQRNIVLKRLEDANLLTVNRDKSGTLISLDAHPLLREYFAKELRRNQAAWQAAHKRLYEHLCTTTQDKEEPALDDLQPLYQAVAHGCQAGLQEESRHKVYFERICHGRDFYSAKKLGAFGSDLGAIACFFDAPWSRVSDRVASADQAWVLGEAARSLLALGRLTEALGPMRARVEMRIAQGVWKSAAIAASNLSELELTLGDIVGAVKDAETSVTHADSSDDAGWRVISRATHADALHQAGRRDAAVARFAEAEAIQSKEWPAYPLLFSLRGFHYCDLLLGPAERAAWRRTAQPSQLRAAGEAIPTRSSPPGLLRPARKDGPESPEALINYCRAVSQRATQALRWAEQANLDILSIALDRLTLGRAALYEAVLKEAKPGDDCRQSLRHAADGLRRAGQQDDLPRGLLTRAWLRGLDGDFKGAKEDLDEAFEIGERGPMPLHLADIHLHRARLFGAGAGRPSAYPWDSPTADLAEARRLIFKHGYLRRKEELEDAGAVILLAPVA